MLRTEVLKETKISDTMVLLRLFDYQGALTVRYHRQRSFYRRRLFAAYSGLASSSFPSLLQSNPKTQKKTPKIISEFLMSFCFLPGYALNLSSSHLLEQIHLLLHFKILMRKNLIRL